MSQSGNVPVEGGNLYYEVEGSGPALALIHAGVADLSMWEAQVTAFKDRFRVIRYDTRGFGRSFSQNVTFSNRDDLRALLDHLNVERAAVCGISRGGHIAIDFTLEFPERVSALIAVAAGLGGFDYKPTVEENAWFGKMEALWKARDFEALAALEEETWVVGFFRPAESVDPALRRRVRAMIDANYAKHSHEELVASQLKPPAAGRLSEIRVPTLIMVGDKDTGDTVQPAHALADGIPGARLIIFPNVAHMVPMEAPDEFNKAVLDFLAEVPV